MKKYFKIQLFDGACDTCEYLALMAARNNSGNSKVTIPDIYQAAALMNVQNKFTPVMVDENTLHVDTKIGDGYFTVLIIELVEVFAIDDIPETLFTASNGHGALAE